MTGGEGNDVLENRATGAIELSAMARVTARAMGYTFAGSGPSTGLTLIGGVDATGMTGNAGADTLFNRGTLNVHADAALKSTGGSKATLTGTSDPDSVGTAEVSAKAAGLSGGDGDDTLGTYGALTVHAIGLAESVNDASTGAISIVNDNYAAATTLAKVSATGLDGGSGVNHAEIAGSLSVTADSVSYALALSSGATVSFASDGASIATSTANAVATGVTGLEGDDGVVNVGSMAVTASATTARPLTLQLYVKHDVRSNDPNAVLAAPPVISADDLPAIDASYPVGAVIFWTEAPADEQDPDNRNGIVGGHYIVDTRIVPGNPPTTQSYWRWLSTGLYVTEEVEYELDTFPSYAAANGNGLDGHGTAIATGSATANARGVSLAGGNNTVDNTGNVTVLAEADGIIHVSADGDAFGDARGHATASSTASAVAVELGDGNDIVRNSGAVTVTARPTTQARAEASGGDICIWFFGWWCGGGGDGYGYATANVTADAAAVRAGGGNNRIVNDGDLTVIASPGVHSDARTGRFVAALSQVNGGAVTVNLASHATGIETGAGNDVVENNGSLVVEARDLASECATCAGAGPTTISISARGIITNDGDDIVTNNGTIRAETVIAGVRASTSAIDTGAGSDQLFLGDGSITVGSVNLATGDDTLTLAGTPGVVDSTGQRLAIEGSSGFDSLVLDGAGSYEGALLSFEHATKRGAGTYTLPSLADAQQLVIDQGTLRLLTTTQLAASGTFDTFLDTDGGSGILSTAGDAVLGGALTVGKRGEGFISNGTRYRIVTADDAVSGEFGTVDLPDARPLLSFSLDQGPLTVDVVAAVPSFASVTTNLLYRRIAANLDSIASDADVDLSTVLGRMQAMSDGFDPAFAGFSPEAHLATSSSTFSNLHEMTRALSGHLFDSRTRYRVAPSVQAPELSLQFSGGSGGLASLQSGGMEVMSLYEAPAAQGSGGGRAPRARRAQAWVLGIDGASSNDGIAGYSAYETDTRGFLVGVDTRIGDEWLVGAQYGRANTDVDTGTLASGDIEGTFVSVYATWFDEDRYLEVGLSDGDQTFRNMRTLTLGSDTRFASSKHDGRARNLFASGGLNFGNERWSVEPFISVNYMKAREDAFTEIGADALNQTVSSRELATMHGAAGTNFAVRRKLRRSFIDFHASLAYDRQFDVGGDDTGVTYFYQGAPQAWFTTEGRPADEESTVYGLGVSLVGDQSILSLDWRGLVNSDRDEQFLSARVSLRF
jgi:uncharacterized protein with beta-barrel porin domain